MDEAKEKHLRLRGEDKYGQWGKIANEETPPPTRRRRGFTVQKLYDPRNTSAYAEKTWGHCIK